MSLPTKSDAMRERAIIDNGSRIRSRFDSLGSYHYVELLGCNARRDEAGVRIALPKQFERKVNCL